MKHRIPALLAALLLAGTTLLGAVACTDSGDTTETTGSDTKVETPAETTPETTPETAPETAPDTTALGTEAPDTEAPLPNESEPAPETTDDPVESETEPEPELDTEIVNVSLNKFVSSNNSLEGLGFFGAAQLVDGSYDDDFGGAYDGANTPLGWHNDTNRAGQSSPDNPSYIDIDLDGMHRISSVKIIPMAFYAPNSCVPADFDLQYSTDGENWTTIQSVTGATCIWGTDEPLVYEFAPVDAGVFRLNITKDSAFNGGYTTLGEIEIFGYSLKAGSTDKPGNDTDTDPSIKLDVNMSDLDSLMQPIFLGNEVKNETVMFIDKTDVKTLLYPIDTIISVTSFDCKKVYEEGKDYVVENGQLKLVEGSSIPVITPAKYYNVSDSMLQTNYNGSNVNTHWGEARAMIDWQININYTHTSTWTGDTQPCESATYAKFLQKLQNGEDVTVFFYGDSITYGANATWLSNYQPNQYPYTILFTQALADLFDYTVHYEQGTARVPSKDYVAGTRGTITYINTAVGGWTSQHGVDNLQKSVIDRVEKSGCDLFVVAFGMNDAGVSPRTTSNNIKTMVDGVLAADADASIVLLSTMVPNPNATNGWYGQQVNQEPQLIRLAKDYTEDGVPCAVARMTTVSLAVLERKEFHDYSGNNINHPNDFFIRVYAQTLLEAVVGYGNMK